MNKNLILTNKKYGKDHLWALAESGKVTGTVFNMLKLETSYSAHKLIFKWAEYEKIIVTQIGKLITDIMYKIFQLSGPKITNQFSPAISKRMVLLAEAVAYPTIIHEEDRPDDKPDPDDHEDCYEIHNVLGNKIHLYITPTEIQHLKVIRLRQRLSLPQGKKWASVPTPVANEVEDALGNVHYTVEERKITLKNLQEITGCNPIESDVTLLEA